MSNVDVDWSQLQAGMAKLAAGIESGSQRVAQEAARDTAEAIRGRLPVLTGRLLATVDVVDVPDGAGVTYGGDLPYAAKIERRTGAVESATGESAARFAQAETEMARREVNSL